MRNKQQLSNPRQQPSERHYHRDHDAYDREELRGVYRGDDYTYGAPSGMPNGYGNRDYAPANYNFKPYRDEPQHSRGYVPSRDYGYERNEYYSMDPAHDSYGHSEATGYGNANSVQGRDFERWLHGENRYRNEQPVNYAKHEFPHQARQRANHDFDEGLYEDYDRHEAHYDHDRRRPQEHYPSYNDHDERNTVIVRPFKSYGHNDYNGSEGFGSNEMVYHKSRGYHRY